MFNLGERKDLIGTDRDGFLDHAVFVNEEGDGRREDPVLRRKLPYVLKDNRKREAMLFCLVPVLLEVTATDHDDLKRRVLRLEPDEVGRH
jgi:hypothetical protein